MRPYLKYIVNNLNRIISYLKDINNLKKSDI